MVPPLLPDSDPLLAQKMPSFDFDTEDARDRAAELAAVLLEAMDYYSGIGIAANQIGFTARAFAMRLKSETSIVMFNPMVTWLSSDSVKITEGCLSFSALELSISRPRECQVAYDDANGVRRVIDLGGIDARCALHEIDHLEGIVFTSLVSRLKLDMARKKARKKA